MKRRRFIQSLSGALGTSAIMLHGTPLRAMDQSPLVNLLKSAGENCQDHVLVMIQLNGGNDGLNTVVPVDSYAPLQQLRSNIIIPENKLLNLSAQPSLKLHPRMTGMQSLFNNGQVSLVQSVGYPNQDFSHFRSTDIWLTASDSDEVLNTGWAGRYFNTDHPNFPKDYPNAEHPDPIAIQLGFVASPAYNGPNANFGHTINSLDEFYDLVEDNPIENTDSPYLHELAFIRRTARQTNAYNTQIKAAAEKADNLSTLYPTEGSNSLADQLKIVARCIAGGLKSKMYLVTLGGFDTHAAQIASNGNPEEGVHANLLGNLSDAILAFQDDIEKLGVSEQVLTTTISEFGRRVRSNGSTGTDHGAAAPLFMIGNKIDAQVYGDNPVIRGDEGPQDNVPMQIDFRSVYSSILRDWFCVDDATITDVLGGDFPPLRLTSTSIAENKAQNLQFSSYPNPCRSTLHLKVEAKQSDLLNLELYNSRGLLVKTWPKNPINRGQNTVSLDVHAIAPGIYHLRAIGRSMSASKSIVKAP